MLKKLELPLGWLKSGAMVGAEGALKVGKVGGHQRQQHSREALGMPDQRGVGRAQGRMRPGGHTGRQLVLWQAVAGDAAFEQLQGLGLHVACKVHAMRWAKDDKEAAAIEEKLYSDFTNFIVAAFTGATVIKPDFTTAPYPSAMGELSDDDKTRAEGYFAFFYAVLRYAFQTLDASTMEGWTSSLPLTEYVKRSMTSASSDETSAEIQLDL